MTSKRRPCEATNRPMSSNLKAGSKRRCAEEPDTHGDASARHEGGCCGKPRGAGRVVEGLTAEWSSWVSGAGEVYPRRQKSHHEPSRSSRGLAWPVEQD